MQETKHLKEKDHCLNTVVWTYGLYHGLYHCLWRTRGLMEFDCSHTKEACNWTAGTWCHFIHDCSEIQPKEAAELMYHQTFFWWNLIEAFAHLSVSSPCWGLGQYNTSDFNEFCSSTGAKIQPPILLFSTNQPTKTPNPLSKIHWLILFHEASHIPFVRVTWSQDLWTWID